MSVLTRVSLLDARIDGRCPLGWSSGDADELWVPPYGTAGGYANQLATVADRMRAFLNNYKRMRAELDPKNPDSPLNALGSRAGGWDETITRLFFGYMSR